MVTRKFTLTRYDADEGKVFDWAKLELHINVDPEGNEIQEHLYVKTLFIGGNDTIDNYVEVDAPVVEVEEVEEETETTVEGE
jgi:hypothetical protein